MASYGTKGRTINSWSSALVFITSRIPVKGTHTAKYCTYGFQLVQRHCGICRSINQESSGDGRQLCLFTTLKTTSTYSHWKHNKARLSMAYIWAAQRHGEQREWVVWSINGSGTTCFITPENQDETLNTEDGCIHHWLMPLSGEDTTFNQTSWLSPFVMQDLKYDGFAFLCF